MLTNDVVERLIAELRKQAEVEHLRTLLRGRGTLHACEVGGCKRLSTHVGKPAVFGTDTFCKAHAEARVGRVNDRHAACHEHPLSLAEAFYESADAALVLRLEKLLGFAE